MPARGEKAPAKKVSRSKQPLAFQTEIIFRKTLLPLLAQKLLDIACITTLVAVDKHTTTYYSVDQPLTIHFLIADRQEGGRKAWCTQKASLQGKYDRFKSFPVDGLGDISNCNVSC